MEALYALLGSVVTAILAFILNFYRTKGRERRADSKRKQEDAKDTMELRQTDHEFIARAYRKLISDHQKDYADLQEQFEELRKITSEEAHGLRSELQKALIECARCEERSKALEERIKRFERRSLELEARNKELEQQGGGGTS